MQALDLKITNHALMRMEERRLNADSVQAALMFGREIHTRGITLYVIGHKEVQQARKGTWEIEQYEGLHVLCGRNGNVVTTYRNYKLRGLRTKDSLRARRQHVLRMRCL